MVQPPSPEAEGRRLSRERGRLIKERIQHVNRIKKLLTCQGVRDYEPLHRDRRARLGELMTGDGCRLPARLRAELEREIARLEQCLAQITQVESERDALMAEVASCDPDAAPATLLRLRGIGPELASLLWLEGLFRHFGNRRQLAAYAGLTPSPWQSGGTEREQGIAKSGNPRLRRAMIELAWFWIRHQPGSALSRWFVERVGTARGRVRRISIVALARKLLVALWRYVGNGIVPEGAVLKA
jgi:transposase